MRKRRQVTLVEPTGGLDSYVRVHRKITSSVVNLQTIFGLYVFVSWKDGHSFSEAEFEPCLIVRILRQLHPRESANLTDSDDHDGRHLLPLHQRCNTQPTGQGALVYAVIMHILMITPGPILSN